MRTNRPKKELTEEQKAAAQATREKMKAICMQLKAMSPEQRLALASKVCVTTIEGRVLSPHNQCMAAMQNPSVTIVGGFWQWKANGRQVIKGKKSLKIWAPITHGNVDLDLQPPAEIEGKFERPRFILVSVFDVSQTEKIGTERKVA